MASLENTHHYCAFQKHANSEDNFRSQLTIAFFAAAKSSLQSSHVCEKRGKTLSYLSLGTIIKKKQKKWK